MYSSSHFFLVLYLGACTKGNLLFSLQKNMHLVTQSCLGFFSFQLDKTEDSELHVRKIQRKERQSTFLCSWPGDEILVYLFEFLRFSLHFCVVVLTRIALRLLSSLKLNKCYKSSPRLPVPEVMKEKSAEFLSFVEFLFLPFKGSSSGHSWGEFWPPASATGSC